MKHPFAHSIYILMIFQLIVFNKLEGQKYYSKLHFGVMYYQGDLSPQNIKLSFGPDNLSYGVSIGRNLTDWLSINARFMYGNLSGSDANSPDLSRRSRNLSFKTPIHEYGLNAEFCINKLWRGLDKYKLRLYYSIGLGLTHFNPQTIYEGNNIFLQPLGTEGQTLSDSEKGTYSLTTLTRPIAILIEFDFSKRFSFGLEISPRKTYTDYLDDVSGVYPNIYKMLESGNELGAKLSNRMWELNGTSLVNAAGSSRGNSKNNDWYTFIGVYAKYSFGKIKAVETTNPPIQEEVLIPN